MPTPTNPPHTHSATASASTSAAADRSGKPSVFMAASSGTRSANACAAVLPVSRTMVKKTAISIMPVIAPMSPSWLANWRRYSSSVVLRVGFEEISNMPSISPMVASTAAGSAIRPTSHPTWSFPQLTTASLK